MAENLISRRHYLIVRAMMDTDCNFIEAAEAVASTAIEHPEWRMAERKTWEEWERGE